MRAYGFLISASDYSSVVDLANTVGCQAYDNIMTSTRSTLRKESLATFIAIFELFNE
jgi:hypothetical protein